MRYSWRSARCRIPIVSARPETMRTTRTAKAPHKVLRIEESIDGSTAAERKIDARAVGPATHSSSVLSATSVSLRMERPMQHHPAEEQDGTQTVAQCDDFLRPRFDPRPLLHGHA